MLSDLDVDTRITPDFLFCFVFWSESDRVWLTACADLDVGRVPRCRQEVQAVGVAGVLVVVVSEVQATGDVLEGEAPALPTLLHPATAQLGAPALVRRCRVVGVATGHVTVTYGRVHVGLEPALTCGERQS